MAGWGQSTGTPSSAERELVEAQVLIDYPALWALLEDSRVAHFYGDADVTLVGDTRSLRELLAERRRLLFGHTPHQQQHHDQTTHTASVP